jgi:hypothetical protein
LKTIAFRAGGALSVGCVSALMTGSGAVFAITRWGSKDGWRLNPSGPQESANEQRETPVCRWNYATQAKTRLEWATRPLADQKIKTAVSASIR